MITPDLRAQLSNGAQIYARGAKAGALPEDHLPVSDWADRYRLLSRRSSPEPGPWRTSRTPFLRQIMDDLSPFSRCQTVVLMKGVQLGATESGNNWVGYNIHMAPAPMMVVQPTMEMARRNAKQRIGPLIEDSPLLRNLVANTYQNRNATTMLSKEFPGGILVMVGANSAKSLRSMSARYLFLDEVDGYPGDVDGEGEPCSLAIARTTNFSRRKIYIASTPVRSGTSRIERFYEASTQGQYYVPCPHCAKHQVLEFERLRWPKGQPEKARYVCEHCFGLIQNNHKETMLARGEWRWREPDRGVHGYHLSSLYSPVGWLTWEQIALKYEEAGDDPELLQAFTNTILGLPWADAAEAPDADRLYERRELYPIGKVPEGGLLLTAGVDVQMRRLECEIVAWGRNRQSWSVDYRVWDGDTAQPEIWQNVAKLLDEDIESAYGTPMRIKKLAVDSGFNTMPVYNFVGHMQSSRVMAVKGSLRASSIIGAASPIEVGPQGARLKCGIRLWPVNTNIAKEELYRRLRLRVPDPGQPWPAGYCHFPQYSREYFEQLTAEQLVQRPGKQPAWEKRRSRNEALDARIYARAAAASIRMDHWPESRWAEIEEGLGKPRVQEPISAAKPKSEVRLAAVPQFKPMPAREDFLE